MKQGITRREFIESALCAAAAAVWILAAPPVGRVFRRRRFKIARKELGDDIRRRSKFAG